MKALQQQHGAEDVECDWEVVARGRTVHAAVPVTKETIKEQLAAGEKQFVGYTRDGESVYGPVLKHYGPGERV